MRAEGTGGATLQDEVTFEVNNRLLVKAGADDLTNWESYGPAPARLQLDNFRATVIEANPGGDRGAIISPPIVLDFGQNPVFIFSGVFPRAEWALGLQVEGRDQEAEKTFYIPFSADVEGKVTINLVNSLRQVLGSTEPEEINLGDTHRVRFLIETRGEGSRLSFFHNNIDLVYQD